jgi:flagellar biosynthesis/type III secretory pathway M-ring protein FliF/YscJ
MSKKHAPHRAESPIKEADLSLAIKQAARRHRRSEAAARDAEKARVAAEKREQNEAPHRKHIVSGALLMDIRDEMESLIDYNQADAGADARVLIERLAEIIATKPAKKTSTG